MILNLMENKKEGIRKMQRKLRPDADNQREIGTDSNIQGDSHNRVLLGAVIFGVAVFIGFFIFFAVVHPLYVYDTDDWGYIIAQRKAIPIWKDWNPTRVLPETLMPLVAELGVRLFMPVMGDYIGSMAIAFALVLSASYSAYFVLIYYLSARTNKIPAHWSLVLGIFMLLLHFLPFMKAMTGNTFMYVTDVNVTCIFYYTIPALLNTSLVLLFAGGDHIEKADAAQMVKEPKLRYGILLLMIYLAINSDMFQSILLIAYIASILLIEYMKGGVKKFLDNFYKNRIWNGVIIVWLLSLLMESEGGRAVSKEIPDNYLLAVGETLKALGNSVRTLNLLFVFLFIAIEGLAVFLFLTSGQTKTDSDKKYVRSTIVYLISLFITTAYLVLICARIGTGYFSRSDVFSGILFYVMMLIWTSLVYIIDKAQTKAVIIAMPVVIYILLFETVICEKTYREINTSNYSASVVKEISDDILEQVLLADSQGRMTMELYVPVYGSSDNWPIGSYGGYRISRALFSHGMISKKIEITIVPTYDKNEQFDLRS